jgi:L-asparaginase II
VPADPPVLLEVRRGSVVESHHRGDFVLLDASGAIEASAGDPDATMFPRSCLKPVQAVALLDAGFSGAAEWVALATGSHDAEDVHIAGVRAMLAAAGVDESALRCPAALPSGPDALLAWVRAGGAPAAVCHNCSGKHAAMVATCVRNGWPIASYPDVAHPLQVLARATVERLCGEAVRDVSVDGCGAPAFAVSLRGLAHAFATIATAADGTSEARVRDAMRAYPRLVGGTGRAVTAFLAGVPGFICKDGAECVWGAALPDGRAFAVKADDGSARALGPLLAAALSYWNVDVPVVREQATVPVLGGGEPVGAIEWSAELRTLLDLPPR